MAVEDLSVDLPEWEWSPGCWDPWPGRWDGGEEELLWREGEWELQMPQIPLLEEALCRAGIWGDSSALMRLLDGLRQLADGDDPVVFCGGEGVGKVTFARLLHRLHSLDSSACQLVYCRDPLVNFSDIACQLLQSLRDSTRPSLILVHPEALASGPRCRFLCRLLEDCYPVRILFTVDSRALDSFYRCLPGPWRRGLRARTVEVPSLDERRPDIRPSVLAQLRELNFRTGLRKRITEAALERLCLRDYGKNFYSLRPLVERLHATQPDVIASAGDDWPWGEDWPCGEWEGPVRPPFGEKNFQLDVFLRDIRRKTIRDALEASAHNQSRAARLLGVTPQSISKFLRSDQAR
jgi:hypothetical protein